MANFHFNNEEDAQNWADRVDGQVYDNTHSPGEDWGQGLSSAYTVHTNDDDE